MSQRRSNAGIGNGQRNGALEHALRTDVFAKERISHPQVVDHQHRQQYHSKQQHEVFDIRKRLELFCRKLFAGNLMKQLLQPAKRAQKAAYKASQQHAEQNERTGYVVGKVEPG